TNQPRIGPSAPLGIRSHTGWLYTVFLPAFLQLMVDIGDDFRIAGAGPSRQGFVGRFDRIGQRLVIVVDQFRGRRNDLVIWRDPWPWLDAWSLSIVSSDALNILPRPRLRHPRTKL